MINLYGDDVPVGARIWFRSEAKPYTVQAASPRYLVCTRPHFETVLYTVLDLIERVRSSEDLVFGLGAETRAQCEQMLSRIENGETGLSRRNEVPLDVYRLLPPKTSKGD